MTSSRKKLIIMVSAVAAAALILILLTVLPDSCDKSDKPAHSHADSIVLSSADADTLLIDRESDELDSIVLTNTNGTFHIVRGEDGQLDITELSGLPLETDFIELAWFYALSVSYTAKLTPDDDLATLASFGLEQPQATVQCNYRDGTVSRVLIGDMLPDQDGRCYFRIDGDDNVYITDFNQSFFQGSTYWLSDDFFNSRNSSVEISDVALSGPVLSRPVRLYPNPASEPWQRWYGYRYIVNEDGTEYPADDYTSKLFLEELETMLADEAVCAHPSAEQKTAFGLDAPMLVISHKRDGRDYTIRMSKFDYSKTYAMVDGIDVVYELKNDTYPVTSTLGDGTLRSPDVLKLYFETVKSLTVQSERGEHSFTLSREIMYESDPPLYEYFITSGAGGASLNSYKALLEVFNSAQAVEFVPGSGSADYAPALRVTIEFFDERRPAETVACYPVGNRRYRFTINGKGDAIVTQMWLDKFIADAETADNGGEVTP